MNRQQEKKIHRVFLWSSNQNPTTGHCSQFTHKSNVCNPELDGGQEKLPSSANRWESPGAVEGGSRALGGRVGALLAFLLFCGWVGGAQGMLRSGVTWAVGPFVAVLLMLDLTMK